MVAIGGLGLSEGLDQSVPLLDEGAQLVSSDVKTVEVRVTVVALDLLALDSDLPPGLIVSVLVQVTKGNLENTTAERLGRDFCKEEQNAS